MEHINQTHFEITYQNQIYYLRVGEPNHGVELYFDILTAQALALFILDTTPHDDISKAPPLRVLQIDPYGAKTQRQNRPKRVRTISRRPDLP